MRRSLNVMKSVDHPFGCLPDERVVLAWRGTLTARDAVREVSLMPEHLRVPVIIVRAADKTPTILHADDIAQLAASPGFLFL